MWLKSLSPGMKLEKLLLQFESRGFRSRRSLANVNSDDLDSFFPSPDKLFILAERHVFCQRAESSFFAIRQILRSIYLG